VKTDKIKLSFVLLALVVLVCSCSKTSWFADRRALQPVAGGPQIDQSGALEKRFNETSANDPTVVESALDLSRKYALLSDQAAAMKQENQRYSVENRLLKEKAASLEAELKQAKKELGEANGLLVDMRVELNNWKNNILGFRDEIRQADSEELKALLEILKILGGEIKTDPNQSGAGRVKEADSTSSPQVASPSNSDRTEQTEVSKK
jgi:chromosome segregation ATPase